MIFAVFPQVLFVSCTRVWRLHVKQRQHKPNSCHPLLFLSICWANPVQLTGHLNSNYQFSLPSFHSLPPPPPPQHHSHPPSDFTSKHQSPGWTEWSRSGQEWLTLLVDRHPVDASILLPDKLQEVGHSVRDGLEGKLAALPPRGQRHCHHGQPVPVLYCHLWNHVKLSGQTAHQLRIQPQSILPPGVLGTSRVCTRFRAGVAWTEDNGGVPQTLKLRSPLLKTQKVLISVLSFKAGVGQNSFTCFTHCYESCVTYISLPGSFSFILPSPL